MIRVETKSLQIACPRADRRARGHAILRAGETMGRGNLAFALALRSDLSPDLGIDLLNAAPMGLEAPEDAWAWVEAIPRHHTATMQ